MNLKNHQFKSKLSPVCYYSYYYYDSCASSILILWLVEAELILTSLYNLQKQSHKKDEEDDLHVPMRTVLCGWKLW